MMYAGANLTKLLLPPHPPIPTTDRCTQKKDPYKIQSRNSHLHHMGHVSPHFLKNIITRYYFNTRLSVYKSSHLSWKVLCIFIFIHLYICIYLHPSIKVEIKKNKSLRNTMCIDRLPSSQCRFQINKQNKRKKNL